MSKLSSEIQQRLDTELNLWLATVRPDGRPHLTPVWFAWYEEKFYACIQAKSVKTDNIEQNPQVALSLEDGSHPIICEGMATFVAEPWSEAVAAIFRHKYDWDIFTDGEYDRLLEIAPVKWLSW